MDYATALKIAEEVKAQLLPHCHCIEIAGSIRRKKADVKDIEIVAIPKPYETGLFATAVATVIEQWKKIKGTLPCKYTQRELPEGIKVDIFFADETNWGWILAIRTGSADYSHKVLATGLNKVGAKAVNGYIYYKGQKQPIREEKHLFDLIGIEMPEPENRNL